MWSVRVCSESHADSIRMAPDQKMMICRVHNTSSNVGKRSSGGHTFPALFLFFLLFFALISGSHHFSSSARDVPGSDSQNTYRSSLLPENTPRLGLKKKVSQRSVRAAAPIDLPGTLIPQLCHIYLCYLRLRRTESTSQLSSFV